MDALLEDYAISEVIVLHLSSADRRTAGALDRLAAEFKDDQYRGHPIKLQNYRFLRERFELYFEHQAEPL